MVSGLSHALLFALALAHPVAAGSGYCLVPAPGGGCSLYWFSTSTPYTTPQRRRWRCPAPATYDRYYTEFPSLWWHEVWTVDLPTGRRQIAGTQLGACRFNRAFDWFNCAVNACLRNRPFADCDAPRFRYPPPNC